MTQILVLPLTPPALQVGFVAVFVGVLLAVLSVQLCASYLSSLEQTRPSKIEVQHQRLLEQLVLMVTRRDHGPPGIMYHNGPSENITDHQTTSGTSKDHKGPTGTIMDHL